MTLTVALLSKFPPTCGQVSTLNLWLAAGLTERGVKVVVCSDALFPRKRAVMATENRESADFLARLLPAVPIVYAEHLSEKVFLPFSELGFVSYLAAARETVREHRPDVILSHYLEPYALAGGQIAAEFGIPHVVTHAGSDIERLCASEPLQSLFRSVLSKASYFVPKSAIAREMFGGDAPVFAVSPYAPNPSYFHGPDSRAEEGGRIEEDPVFGFYGKFVNGKGLDKLISAFRAYRKSHGKGRLLLVGGEIGGAFSLQRLLDADLDLAVEVRGFVPNWEIPRLLNDMTCLVYTKAGYRIQQHASIILREAVACGTPVIATLESLGGTGAELLRFGRIRLVEPDADPEELSRVMAAMVIDPPSAAGSPREYFERGYGQYIDSWHRCLVQAVRGRPSS